MRAIIPGRAAEVASEFAGKVALIDETAVGRHVRQRLIRVDQGSAGHAQSQLAQVLLRRNMETTTEFAFEGPDRHVRQTGQLSIGDRFVVVIAQVRQERTEFGRRNHLLPGRVQPLRDSRGADDGPVRVGERDFVGYVPDRHSLGLADQLNAIDDPLAGQHLLIIQAILIGEEGRRQVVIGLADNVFRASACVASGPIHRVVDPKSPIDPEIAAIAVLDPYQSVFDGVEQRR